MFQPWTAKQPSLKWDTFLLSKNKLNWRIRFRHAFRALSSVRYFTNKCKRTKFSLRQKNERDHDVRKVSSSCLRYYTNIGSQYTWYTSYINEAPFCYIRPVDLPRLSWLDHTIRSKTFTIDRASIYHFVMSMPSYTVKRLLQSTTIIVDGIYNIYKSWHVVDRPLLAVENCTMVLSQRQNSTSYAQKI